MDSPEVSEAAMKAERQLAEMRNDINWGVIRTRRVAVEEEVGLGWMVQPWRSRPESPGMHG